MTLRYTHISFKIFILALALAIVVGDRAHPKSFGSQERDIKNDAERSTEYWNYIGQNILAKKLAQEKGVRANFAKNVILFMGDGMSAQTIAASRDLMIDAAEELSFEKFPYVGLAKTYCLDRQVSDSACTTTAYLGGTKGNYGTIGVDARVSRYDCDTATNPSTFRESIARWAQEANIDTGFVTTTRVTHASPAGMYAHTANRDWENDAKVKENQCSAEDNVDIARQLVEWPVGKNLKLIMGGGRQNFLDKSLNDEQGYSGAREDGRNLIEEWLTDKKKHNLSAEYVWSKKGLEMVDLNSTDYLMGLFANSHLPFQGDMEREHLTKGYPSLTQMTETAIKFLSKNANGYFLFVEGGLIDVAHHETRARKALEETIELDRAITLARRITNEEDTLIVVTADHAHTMTLNGYPHRDEEVTGVNWNKGDDDLPFTALSYANGLGYGNTYSKEAGRLNVRPKDTLRPDFEYMSTVPMNVETHGGDDTAVYASGPYAQYFSGNYEQSNIAAMMARAINIGPFADVNTKQTQFKNNK